jgi:hypothetical protein
LNSLNPPKTFVSFIVPSTQTFCNIL